jgi:hypothetical protein
MSDGLRNPARTTKRIGFIGVDAGCVWIGDPSFIMGDRAPNRVYSWDNFVFKLARGSFGDTHYQTPLGDDCGIAIQAGKHGELYPVYMVCNEYHQVVRVIVDFNPDGYDGS